MALHFSQARDEHAAGRVVDVLARLGFEHLRHLTPINVPEGMLIRLRTSSPKGVLVSWPVD
jgi:hypothetical protein